MFNNDNEFLTHTDKIDKIYILLKKQHRMNIISSVFRWISRFIIIYILYFGYGVFVQDKNPELKTKLTSYFSTVISSIVNPIVNDVIKDNIGDINKNFGSSNVKPEDIDAFLKTLKK